MTESNVSAERLADTLNRAQEILDYFDAEANEALAGETERGDLWSDIEIPVADLRTLIAAAKVRAIREGDAVRDVLEERQRQIAKGYDAAHDDEHVDCEILTHPIWGIAARAHNARTIMMPLAYRRAVVELAAMSLAEIERLDRSLFPGALK